MKIWFTGGSSLLALNWACWARNRHDVALSVRSRPVTLAGASTTPAELGDVDAIRAKIRELRPGVIVNTAAMANVDECELKPDAAREINAEFPKRLATAARLEKTALIHISTDHLFSGRDKLLTEDATPSPLNVYAVTKADGERFVSQAHPEALVLRTNFFAWGHAARSSFTDWIVAGLRSGSKIGAFSDVFFTPLEADALAEAAHSLLEGGFSGIFNVVGDQRISKLEFARSTARHFGYPETLVEPITLAEKKLVARRPLDMSLDNRKARDALGRALGGVDEHIERLKALEHNGRAREIRAALSGDKK